MRKNNRRRRVALARSAIGVLRSLLAQTSRGTWLALVVALGLPLALHASHGHLASMRTASARSAGTQPELAASRILPSVRSAGPLQISLSRKFLHPASG